MAPLVVPSLHVAPVRVRPAGGNVGGIGAGVSVGGMTTGAGVEVNAGARVFVGAGGRVRVALGAGGLVAEGLAGVVPIAMIVAVAGGLGVDACTRVLAGVSTTTSTMVIVGNGRVGAGKGVLSLCPSAGVGVGVTGPPQARAARSTTHNAISGQR